MYIGLFFLLIIALLGWLYGHSWHKNIPPSLAITMPSSFAWIFGKPGTNNQYNIQGVYFQMMIFMLA